ncbi:MAG: hypothetical protein ABIZ52_00035 [Candidatus Limnocylindrales bacterium]
MRGSTSCALTSYLYPVRGFAAAGNTKAKANLTWDAATDNVGVTGDRVYRNGTLGATVTGRTWSESRQRLATTYTVRAIDAAGNLGPVSNSLLVPKK